MRKLPRSSLTSAAIGATRGDQSVPPRLPRNVPQPRHVTSRGAATPTSRSYSDEDHRCGTRIVDWYRRGSGCVERCCDRGRLVHDFWTARLDDRGDPAFACASESAGTQRLTTHILYRGISGAVGRTETQAACLACELHVHALSDCVYDARDRVRK